ncbi:MAG: iron dicitrate transport regulator FecR, partial [Planctomycetes bacterium]|nr:iron dicitrate transport regulator FecR [Planctomycetota bacterium]
MNIDNWITAVRAIQNASRLVVFTGAGISVESGIPTFRDAEGFWQRFPPEKYATWSGLAQTALSNPRSVADFLLNVIEPIALAEANAGHHAVVELQNRIRTTIVTQNIDGLHQAAGATDVWEIHGSLLEVVDTSSGQLVKRFERKELIEISATLRKFVENKSSLISFVWELQKQYPFSVMSRNRPNLVLFGDDMAEPAWTKSCQAVDECDVLLTVGTSGLVYPAASLPERAAT